MKETFVIKKILIRTDGVKYIVIPKASELIAGDYVMISKINQDKKYQDKNINEPGESRQSIWKWTV